MDWIKIFHVTFFMFNAENIIKKQNDPFSNSIIFCSSPIQWRLLKEWNLRFPFEKSFTSCVTSEIHLSYIISYAQTLPSSEFELHDF